MSVRIEKDAVHLPDDGLVLLDTLLVLRDADGEKPPSASAVWLVVEPPEGDPCWELGEWHKGGGIGEEGWYLVGGIAPLKDSDYRVLYYCYEPPLPKLDKQS